MANMSYCRFQNTASDLRDCVTALEELLNDPEAEPLSRDEDDAADWMETLCRRYLEARSALKDAG